MSALPATATAVAQAVLQGELRAVDVAQTYLSRIQQRDPSLRAYVEVFGERAMAAAEALDQHRRRGQNLGPLAGVPVALKDNLLLQGEIAACGSRMLEHFRAPYTATVVARMQALGAVVLGRTNMDEFGMGSSTERSAFGPTRNPWDPALVPGGSSGGSAAAVAADLCLLALGSDTGGSVRQPAALCGVTGLKPSYGRLSRYGLIAYASSLDCIGLLARSVEDLALGMQVAGHDPCDSTCDATTAPDYAGLLAARRDLRGLRIGIVREFAQAKVEPQVAECVHAALAQCQALGATLVDVSVPSAPHAVATYYLLAATEASSNLARYDGVRYGHRAEHCRRLDELYERSRSEGFGAEVQLRILLGTYALQKGYEDRVYGQATRIRARIAADFAAAFAHCDLIASATSPVAAFALGSKLQDPLAMYWCDALTVPHSLAGLPAMSLPCGFAAGLPVGLQLAAPRAHEALLLQAGHVFQQSTDWHQRRPGT
jgi:aspartyl-tRNA(Asn)/glutamyl-tRNA(Gln) amidotransferase subunit A